ncbi:hypothetical protein [uncultured Acetobacteroides sp.]|uniref:hypothetical protein n=1 Tax=uncultured Acetobacteroides sp. TaxID=1760811 RepID=UPI0029F4CA15|nr:hypothetical protein [uncultured Acetobacteroides sp.]
MKKFALLALTVALATQAFSYDFTNKELALNNLNIDLKKEIREMMDKSDPSFLASPKGENKFHFLCYYTVESSMKAKGINVFPLQCFGSKAAIDAYGFPDIATSKAVKTNVAKYYYKLDIEIALLQMVNHSKAKISVKMILTPFRSPSIIPMEKIDVNVESEVALNEAFLEGFTANADEVKEGSLMWAICRASDKLSKIMVQK